MKKSDMKYLYCVSKHRLLTHRKNLRNILNDALKVGFSSSIYEEVKEELDGTREWYSGFHSGARAICCNTTGYAFLNALHDSIYSALLDSYTEYRLMFAVSKSIDRHNRKGTKHG